MAVRFPDRNLLALSIFAVLGSAPFTAPFAQDADTGAEPKETTTLSAISVTAQKREEALQDVPIALSVLPEQLIQDTGVRDVKDMQLLVPGLSVTSTANESQTTIRMRGVGTVGDNPGLESSVGVVIDGVYRPRNGVGFGDLGEIERIEVLKGPQGTVFGKNTSAGIVNVITRRPSYTRSVEGEITAGNYGALGLSAAYNDAIGEHAAFRIYATQRERDGVNDVITGAGPRTSDADGTLDFKSARGQFLYEPNDDLSFLFIADTTSRDEECCTAVTVFRGPAAGIVDALAGGEGVIPVVNPSRRLTYSNRDTNTDVNDRGYSLEMNWQTPWFGGATLTSITASRDWDSVNASDLDFSAADIWIRNFGPDSNSVQFDTFSQELRLTGSSDRVDWMAGLFYTKEDLVRHDSITMGTAYEPYLSIALLNNVAANFPAGVVNTAGAATFLSQAAGRPFGTTFVGTGSNDVFDQNAKSTALFTNMTFHATDALDLTLGLRYTSEKKEVDAAFSNPNGGLGCAAGLTNPSQVGAALAGRGVPGQFIAGIVPTVIGFMCLPWSNVLHNGLVTHQESDEDEWSGTVKAAYRWNDHVMGYFSAARGYKAGGFNLDRVQEGVTPLSDTYFPGEFVDSYELGAKTTWMDGNLLFNSALFHQEYSDFQLNTFIGTSFVVRSVPELTTRGLDTELLWQTPVDGLAMQAGAIYTHARYGNQLLDDAALFRLPGNTAGFAPKWQTTASVTYEWDMTSNLIGRFNIGAKHTTDYNTGSDLAPQKVQDAFTLLNARFAIGSPSASWMVELWAQNLTDETYKQVAFDAPLQTGSYNAFLGLPRTYGATLRLIY